MRLLRLFIPNLSPESFLFAFGVALLPVYAFSSGGAQPAHIVLAIFFTIVLLKNGLPRQHWSFFLAAISVYSFSVECFYTIMGGKPVSMMSGAFFFYNFLLSSSVYLHCRNKGLSAVAPGVLISCVTAVAAVIFYRLSPDTGAQVRSVGMFNNPNQLGYFSVCLLSLSYLLYIHRFIGYFLAISVIGAALFLSIASLSKAAMVANFLVILFAIKPTRIDDFLDRSIRVGPLLCWLFFIVFTVFAGGFFYAKGVVGDYGFVQRLGNIASEGDSSLVARGYWAFLQGNSVQIFLGLGNSKVSQLIGHEVHSTFGSMFNNYGFLGFFLFFNLMLIWLYKIWRAYGFVGMLCISAPAMLYGITHNGTRFSLFWILFSVSMAMADNIISKRTQFIDRNSA